MSAYLTVNLYRNNPAFRAEKDCIPAVQGEGGLSGLKFHLFENGSCPLDLTGKTVTYYFTKPDGEKIFLPAGVAAETAAQGIAAVTLTTQCTATSGLTSQGEVRVSDSGGGVLKFPTPDIFIAASDTEGAVESTSEFYALDIALKTTNENLKDAQNAVKGAQEAVINS